MNTARTRRLAGAAILGALLATSAFAQPRDRADCEASYKPWSGQEGKDVVWVPTPDEVVARMLRMAGTGPNDYVIDLGAGDGKIAIAAAKHFGARALGIEYNPQMVKLAQCMVQVEKVGERARVIEGDIFKVDFSKADVLTMYLLPQLNLCVRHRVLAMRPGVRVVSHQFTMGEWEADETGEHESHSIFHWIVPARVGGSWSFREVEGAGLQFRVNLTQSFQKIGGEAILGSERRMLLGAALRGDEIRFAFHDDKGVLRAFKGKVSGREIAGELRGDGGVGVGTSGSLQGVFAPAPWADMLSQCSHHYAAIAKAQ